MHVAFDCSTDGTASELMSVPAGMCENQIS